ncbi:hypothetical protein A5662_14180 [Mycobacteriaceae bacterium 1482268.1]|nr:hypothetical protein A5662_14180 [Mycobacteriaceae bacterium 1482268.1]
MKTIFAAAALTAAACVSGPVATAAPDCQSYKFTGMGNIIEDYGPDLFTGWNADGRSGRVNTRDGYYSMNTPDRVPEGYSMNGNIKGGIDGRHVHFFVTWDDAGVLTGTTDEFYGQVESETDIRGDLRRGVNGQGDLWHWQGAVKCVDTASAAPKEATVVAATDIYDKPDGKGQKIGTLNPGEVHPLMEPCRDDWCRVGQIELGGYDGLPNGTAWVYAKGYLTFS